MAALRLLGTMFTLSFGVTVEQKIGWDKSVQQYFAAELAVPVG